MNDESAVEEDQEEEEYYSDSDDETYDGEGDEDRLSDDQFVNESSDEGVGGIENDYDSDGNVIDDDDEESDDDDDYDEDDDDDAMMGHAGNPINNGCLLYTSPSPRDGLLSRMPSSA